MRESRRELGSIIISLVIVISLLIFTYSLQGPEEENTTHKIVIKWEQFQSSEFRFSVHIFLCNSENDALNKMNATLSIFTGIGPETRPDTRTKEYRFTCPNDFTWVRIGVSKLVNDELEDYRRVGEEMDICKLVLGVGKSFSMLGFNFALTFEKT